MPFDRKSGAHDFAALITLELLFRTEMDFVMNTARRCGLSDPDAEDVTQQVFIALQRRLHTLCSPESVRPWLLTVTRRKARARFGAGSRTEAALPDHLGEIVDETPAADEMIAQEERRRELIELLESIEPPRRIVLVMHVLDDVPMCEVAEALEIPVATAYNRLRLARRDLQDILTRRRSSEEFAMLYRRWEKIALVRDPTDFYYGREALSEGARERLWQRVLGEIRRAHGTLEQAEIDGLQLFSPMLSRNAPPKPYPRLKRQPRMPKAERLPIRW
ncbi:MAG: sigma-70 family RNA polymerase sigma factor [Polyangiaceae bacterium]